MEYALLDNMELEIEALAPDGVAPDAMPFSGVVLLVQKAVRHESAGQTEVNPETGKTIKGGEFAPANGTGTESIDIEKLISWGPKKRVMVGGVTPKDVQSASIPYGSAFWDTWRSHKDALKEQGVSIKKDDYGNWVAQWWRVPSVEDQKEVQKDAAAGSKRLDLSIALDAKLKVPKGPSVPADQDYHPFQRAAIAYAKDLDGVLFAEEMGLGKTVEAIGLANLDKTVKNVLVIVPASLRMNWEQEWNKWGSNRLKVGRYRPGDTDLPKTNVVILNYENVAKFRSQIDARKWDMLILDEAHRAKGDPKEVQCAAAIFGGLKTKLGKLEPIAARRKAFLTGTPILNRPKELWNIVHALDPQGLGKSWWAFHSRYCDLQQTAYGINVNGASNLAELQQKLRSRFMRRVLKADAWRDMPTKLRQLVPIEPNMKAKAIIEKMKAKSKAAQTVDELKRAGKQATAEFEDAVAQLQKDKGVDFESMSTLREELAIAKVPEVVSFCRDLLEDTNKIVIMAHHKEVVDRLMKDLAKYGPVKIVGGMTDEGKTASKDAFQTDPKTRVLIGNIRAAGQGYTLTAADTCVFAEQDWTPGYMQQAEDRIHRLGQDSPFVNYYTLVFDNTLESHMAQVIVDKARVAKRAQDSDGKTGPDKIKVPKIVEPSKTKIEVKSQSLAVTFTPAQQEILRSGLEELRAMSPDGVALRNDYGFSGSTLKPGMRLLQKERWTNMDMERANDIIRLHQKQVGARFDKHGKIIDLANPPADDAPPAKRMSTKTAIPTAPVVPVEDKEWAGEVGKRREFTNLKCTDVREERDNFSPYGGTIHVYTFKDPQGRTVTWKSKNREYIHEGSVVRLEGLVKEHTKDWKSKEPVTRLTNVKLSDKKPLVTAAEHAALTKKVKSTIADLVRRGVMTSDEGKQAPKPDFDWQKWQQAHFDRRRAVPLGERENAPRISGDEEHDLRELLDTFHAVEKEPEAAVPAPAAPAKMTSRARPITKGSVLLVRKALPSEAQIAAGNYAKPLVRMHGMEIRIENPKGSTRSGVDRHGKKWSCKIKHSYGYIRNIRS